MCCVFMCVFFFFLEQSDPQQGQTPLAAKLEDGRVCFLLLVYTRPESVVRRCFSVTSCRAWLPSRLFERVSREHQSCQQNDDRQ